MRKNKNLDSIWYTGGKYQESESKFLLIRDRFIPAFVALNRMLEEKMAEVDENWNQSGE